MPVGPSHDDSGPIVEAGSGVEVRGNQVGNGVDVVLVIAGDRHWVTCAGTEGHDEQHGLGVNWLASLGKLG